MTTRLATAILGALLLPSVLPAQNETARFITRMKNDDANGDGKLTQAEFTGPDRLFQQLDGDGDGVLVLTEAAEKLKERRTRVGNMPRQAAGNADNRTQPDESRPRAPGIRGRARAQVKPDFQNVRYGEHERHVFDIYQADTENKEPAPCMIWIHGGGFRRGDKSEGSLFSTFFTNNGIHYVTLNYRLSHQAIAPACFQDCARAVQFIRRNADKWNIDKSRIAVGGGSAGAGLAQWLGFSEDHADPSAADPVMHESTRVSALVLLNAQTSYDFRWIKQHIPGDAWQGDGLQELFGYTIEDADEIAAAKYRVIEDCSPINHFSADDPPILFFYRRSKDPKIAEQNAMDGIHHPLFGLELKKLADKLELPCEVFTVENREDLAFYNRRWDYTVSFLKKQFQME
ncbi:Lipase 2 [Planctomycetes bacterium CA13]|uniref:Lipase 2 n=1 Tax=Novipirellula herctigrandis TaxID=2527986 RepID=A0A5C5YXC1_9BACT|nr:Lipase 2 [Planctomycetes bacterium CA13]